MSNQGRRVTTSRMFRVGANRADFSHSRNRNPLTRHGDQMLVLEHAEISSQLISSLSEKAGESDIGQRDHSRCIVWRQSMDLEATEFRHIERLRISVEM